tara:strand:- start:214 stop:915 length:702 start_codon:yes stop_codon:yes gene_type:complete
MKTIETVLKILTYIVLAISISYFVLSIIDFVNLGREKISFDTFYYSISEYSGIHKFMLAVLASYLGLSRLRLSYESHQKTLDQLKLTQTEIERKVGDERINETLKQCEFYLTDIQKQFKELVQSEYYSGIPLIWSGLETITRESLETKYKASYNKFLESEKELKSESLLTLYKLEAFATIFLKGNRDLELGKKVIGNTYSKQVAFLLGLIAFYQSEGNENLFSNTLELKKLWE